MKLLVTGATGFLGWRTTVLLRKRGHDVVPVARPGGARRAHARGLDAVELDAGGDEIRDLVMRIGGEVVGYDDLLGPFAESRAYAIRKRRPQ